VAPTFDDCYPWQPGGCEWTIRYLWRWMNSYGRLDVIVLALMLVYLFAVVIHVCGRYYLAQPARGNDNASRGRLAAVLSIEVGGLKSIAITAPYLGLAGTCLGLWSALGGGAMQKDAFRVMVETKIAVALIPTVAGIPVAALATCFYNFLRTRIDLLEGEVSDEGQQSTRHFQGSRRFPPTKRFSELPAFGLLAVPALAISIAGFMTFASFHPSRGLYVKLLAHTSASECGDSDVIVLRLLSDHSFRINSERVPNEYLRGRLREIFRSRAERILVFRAEPEVSFQEVVNAIGISHDAVSNLYVALLTPATEKEPCPVITMPRELPKLPH
jgi:biopolymer transport protein ExbD